MPSPALRSVLSTLTSPRMLVLHAAGVAAVTIALLLSAWQYGAWQSGRDLAARDLADQPALPLHEVLGADDAFPNDRVGQPVHVAGTWLPAGTVEVSGRRLDGSPGRWVVTPVAVCDDGECAGDPAILVVRGFLADGTGAPDPPAGRVELTGWLQPGEGSGLPDPDPDDDVLPELRIASAVQHVDTDLYGGYLIAESPDSVKAGLEPVTPAALPEPDTSTSLRNLLYAGEWVVFGGFALFLWWRWARDEIDRVNAAEAAPDDDAPAGEQASSAEIASSS